MLITDIQAMQAWSDQQRTEEKTIGFVPTMGALHQGHLSLIGTARRECDVVITSVFVNPLQFGTGEDYERYPRNIERDTTLAIEAGSTVVFAPSVEAMYPTGFTTSIDVGPLGEKLEGNYRPGHFRGVATVVAKLFNITKPHCAYFGQKDYQQTLVIRQLVTDLNFNITLRILPTIREADGLAMSSRNIYLTPDERSRAAIIYKALCAATNAIEQGERSRTVLCSILTSTLLQEPLTIDYAFAALADSLEEPETFQPGDKIVLLVACRVGGTRLIDNMIVQVPLP